MKLRTALYKWLSKDANDEAKARSLVIGGSGSSAYYAPSTLTLGSISITTDPEDHGPPARTMTIKIRPATGGTIIQIGESSWDSADLYVISDGQDFDSELGKIITLARLKQ